MRRVCLVLVMLLALLVAMAPPAMAQGGFYDRGHDNWGYDDDKDYYDHDKGYDDDKDYYDDHDKDYYDDHGDYYDHSPRDPQCGWYPNWNYRWAWWEYWCWWPGFGWELVFWVWA